MRVPFFWKSCVNSPSCNCCRTNGEHCGLTTESHIMLSVDTIVWASIEDTIDEPLEIDCAAAFPSALFACGSSSVSIVRSGAYPVVRIRCTNAANCGSLGAGTGRGK
eukprot:6465566-Amphidinium_carterae.1